MAFSTTSPTGLGNSSYGGALFILPREIRDDIYRLVVKNHYIIYVTQGENDATLPAKQEHDFAILEVSKVVNLEASEILYSESVFRFAVDCRAHGIVWVPTHLTDRMKNVAITFGERSDWCPDFFSWKKLRTYLDHRETICQAVIASFTGAKIARNNLHIRLFFCGPELVVTQWIAILDKFNSFIGFRTIVLEVITRDARRLLRNLSKLEVDRANERAQKIRDILEPTLGLATPLPHRDNCHVVNLIFHPRKFVNSNMI